MIRTQSINTTDIFVPLMPLLEDRQALATDTDPHPCTLLSDADVTGFLAEHRRTLDEKLRVLVDTFPSEETADNRLMFVGDNGRATGVRVFVVVKILLSLCWLRILRFLYIFNADHMREMIVH